jgi:hypothetical protein
VTEAILALWNHQPGPAHVLVVLQAQRRFFVRELAPRTAMHFGADSLWGARVFFTESAGAARALAARVAAGFAEVPKSSLVPGPKKTEAGARDKGPRRRAQEGRTWRSGRRRTR